MGIRQLMRFWQVLVKHGEPWDAGPSIELVYDSKLIEEATANTEMMSDLIEADYVLLSEEDVEKEISADMA